MPLAPKSLEHLALNISARVGVVKRKRRKSDDSSSDDSDYQDSSNGKTAEKKSKKPLKTSVEVAEVGEVPELPHEILHKIFLYAVKDVGAIPLLFKLRAVCVRFKEVVEMPNGRLWDNLDLSQIDFLKRTKAPILTLVMANCRNGNFTRSLSLSGSGLTPELFKELILTMPKLENLNLSYCGWLNEQNLFGENGLLTTVQTELKSLKSLDLSGVFKKKPFKCVEPFKTHLAPMKLTSLNLSDNCLADLNKLITGGDKTLGPQLAELDISNGTSGGSLKPIPIVNLLQTFPELKVFKAVESQFDWLFPKHLQIKTDNFAALATLTDVDISYLTRCCFGYDHTGILRLLTFCPNLKRICLDKHSKLQWSELIPLLSDRLTHLSLANCLLNGPLDEGNFPNSVVDHLVELNISWLSARNFHHFHQMLTSARAVESHLEQLHLVGTTVTEEQLRQILSCHSGLTVVDISSCRALQTGLKRSYNGRTEVENLRKLLN